MAQKPDQSGDDSGAQFVRQIVTDPNNVPDVTLIYGYLGASSEEDHERLYLSTDLANYVEDFPRSAILHRVAASKEQDPHGGTTLWVKKDAALINKMAPAVQALAHYFAGAIQAGAGPAAAGPGAAAGVWPTIGGPACGVTLPQNCQVASAQCTLNTCGIACTIGPPCQTQATPCPTFAGQQTCFVQCTQVAPCPTHVTPCHVTLNGQPTCFVQCTQIAPCPTHATPCLTLAQQTCLVQCTHFAPCPTHVATPCISVINPNCHTHPPFGPCRTIPGAATCNLNCTIAGPVCRTPFAPCPTAHVGATCAPYCTIVAPVCHPLVCQFETAAGCPQVTEACPQFTQACGGIPDPGAQAALAAARLFSIGCSPVCTGVACQTPAPCTPNCPQ